jgi:uncharacterized membrane protein
MATFEAFSRWLHSTTLSWAVAGGIPWLWPLCETIHFLAMALLIGVVGLLDIRMLGFAKGLPPAQLERLIPWGIGAFVVNAVTGVLFYIGDPFQYIHNNVFWLKMLFIVLAGLNVLAFYVTGVRRAVEDAGPDGDVPAAAKLIAATSLFLWFGVMFFGRMLPFLGGAF